ncbi:MAG: sugar phosphate nucleotidyltransferase [Eubacterium sp.]
MKVILLSGGSGTRLWPLSNEARSKQFLKVLKDEKGQKQSMVQRVYRQLKKQVSEDDILVATNQNQVDSIKDQIGETTQIVIEPERRNTYPAIALAVSKLFYEEYCSPDEVVVVLPIDSYAEDHYFKLIKNLAMVAESDVDICLMGVAPTYPSEKYGYIVPDKSIRMHYGKRDHLFYQQVKYFKEKPTETEAKRLMDQGGLWNCGIFAFQIKTLIAQLKKDIAFDSYDAILAAYRTLEEISFDYKVVEKAESVAVVEYVGIWKDLGTWNTLCEQMEEAIMGDVVLSETATNTQVINELDIPTIVVGIKDAVVVASHDGILVSDKKESSYLKDYLSDKMLRPMYEKRCWGQYTVLDHGNREDGIQMITKKLEITAGKNISYQYHEKRSETWAVIEGSGFFVLNEKVYIANPGNVFRIKIGDKHTIRAIENLTLIEIQIGTDLIEDDIRRLEKNWDKILLACGLPEFETSFNGE